jgi:hypothetical protein
MLRVYLFEPRTGTGLDYAAESMKLVRASVIKELRLLHRRYQDLPEGHEAQRKAKENRGDGGTTHAQRVKVHLYARGRTSGVAPAPVRQGRKLSSLGCVARNVTPVDCAVAWQPS